MWETWVRSLGWEDSLEEGMATHSNILAWRIPWTEEPGGLQSMGSQESDTTLRLNNNNEHGSQLKRYKRVVGEESSIPATHPERRAQRPGDGKEGLEASEEFLKSVLNLWATSLSFPGPLLRPLPWHPHSTAGVVGGESHLSPPPLDQPTAGLRSGRGYGGARWRHRLCF